MEIETKAQEALDEYYFDLEMAWSASLREQIKISDWQWLQLFRDSKTDLKIIIKGQIADSTAKIDTLLKEIQRLKMAIRAASPENQKKMGLGITFVGAMIQYEQDKIAEWKRHLDFLKVKKGKSLHGFTEEEIITAKNTPIQEFYPNKLRRLGSRQVGLCPFHTEKTGSFVLYAGNNWFCFGCDAGGDSINFLMKLHTLTFVQAVNKLIRKE